MVSPPPFFSPPLSSGMRISRCAWGPRFLYLHLDAPAARENNETNTVCAPSSFLRPPGPLTSTWLFVSSRYCFARWCLAGGGGGGGMKIGQFKTPASCELKTFLRDRVKVPSCLCPAHLPHHSPVLFLNDYILPCDKRTHTHTHSLLSSPRSQSGAAFVEKEA